MNFQCYIPQEYHLHNNYPGNPIWKNSSECFQSIGLLISDDETLVLFIDSLCKFELYNLCKYAIQDKNSLFIPLDNVHGILHNDDVVENIPGKKGKFKVHIFAEFKRLF